MIEDIEKILERHGLKKPGAHPAANLAANEIADYLEEKIQARIADAKTRECVVEGCKNRIPDDGDHMICDAHRNDGRVIVTVNGGLVQSVDAPDGTLVTVVDLDNLDVDPGAKAHTWG